MIKLSIAARKGGQARSTTAFNLAGAFAKLGHRTIVIDAQPTLSKCFLPAEDVDGLSPEQTVCALYDETLFPSVSSVLHPTPFENIQIVPGHVTDLARFDHPTPEEYPHLCESLRDFMPELEPHADVCIMDTAPTTYVLTYSTLVAADFAITPVVCDKNSVQELPMVRGLVDKVGDFLTEPSCGRTKPSVAERG